MAGKSTSLTVKILADAKPAAKGFADAERSAGGFGKKLAGLGKVAAVGLAGITAGAGLAVAGFAEMYAAAAEARKVTALTEQVIKSTGGAAKVTAEHVTDLASAIAAKTGVDDAAIQSGQNLLLTFTNLKNGVGKGNDIFDQATKIMTDMSVALGTDAKGSAIQLGKALNDPIKGVSALSRVGVSFTAQQKEQIKTLVESGKTLDAQKIILSELGKEFGGAAEAAATPLDRLKFNLGEVGESIGTALLPAVDSAATFLNDKLGPALSGATAEGSPLHEMFGRVSGFVTASVLPTLGDLASSARDTVAPALGELATKLTDTAIPAFKGLWTAASEQLIPYLKETAGPAVKDLADNFGDVSTAVRDNSDKFGKLYEQMKPVIDFIRTYANPVIERLGSSLNLGGTLKYLDDIINALGWIADHAADALKAFKNSPTLNVDPRLNGPFGSAAGQVMGSAAGGVMGASVMGSTGGGSAPAAAGGPAVGATVVNITVNGALDPVAVGRQVSDMVRRYGVSIGTQTARVGGIR